MSTVKIVRELSYKEVTRGKTGCVVLKKESLYSHKQTTDIPY